MDAVASNAAPPVVVAPQAPPAPQSSPAAPQASAVATSTPASTGVVPQPNAASQSGAGLKKGLDAMNNRRPAQDGELPRHAKAQSGVVGELDAGVMSASRDFADAGRRQRRHCTRAESWSTDSKRGAQTWIGTFDGAPGSSLVLTKSAGMVSGFANINGQTLEILPSTAGKHVLFAVDSSQLPKSDGVIK